MTRQKRPESMRFTGRIEVGPHDLLNEEILTPQFHYELRYLLPYYVLIEKVLLLEYKRMGLLEQQQVSEIGDLLDHATADTLLPEPQVNMSDIAFALEQFVESHMRKQAVAWHVDRSRNDLQACAQLMFGRDRLFEIVDSLSALSQAIMQQAKSNIDVVMPGYTHYQSAQVISPAFYLSALLEHLLVTSQRLLDTYDTINLCPLGAGAMAGQQLLWDRVHMAHLLAFRGPQLHALKAVASRDWTLYIVGELSTLSITLSRFLTDLMAWGSSTYGFIALPDELSSISSAMPQKKNYPLLERIRGKTAHISAYYVDFLLGQRNTPYTNLVEVSKEAGSHLISVYTTFQSLLRLMTAAIEQMRFQEGRMREVCEHEYMGGFALANYLTLQEHIPYRTAQRIVGRYITKALQQRLNPSQSDSALLKSLCKDSGYDVTLSDADVQRLFDSQYNLQMNMTSGSTGSQAVNELLTQQNEKINSLSLHWQERLTLVQVAYRTLAAQVAPGQEGSEREK